MIDRNHRLALTKQSALLGISRSSVYYEPAPVPDADLALMRRTRLCLSRGRDGLVRATHPGPDMTPPAYAFFHRIAQLGAVKR